MKRRIFLKRIAEFLLLALIAIAALFAVHTQRLFFVFPLCLFVLCATSWQGYLLTKQTVVLRE